MIGNFKLHAPLWVFKRLIQKNRITKKHIKKLVDKKYLNYEDFFTIITENKFIINNRLIIFISLLFLNKIEILN